MAMVDLKQIKEGQQIREALDELLSKTSKEAICATVMEWLLEEVPDGYDPDLKQNSRIAEIINKAASPEMLSEQTDVEE